MKENNYNKVEMILADHDPREKERKEIDKKRKMFIYHKALWFNVVTDDLFLYMDEYNRWAYTDTKKEDTENADLSITGRFYDNPNNDPNLKEKLRFYTEIKKSYDNKMSWGI